VSKCKLAKNIQWRLNFGTGEVWLTYFTSILTFRPQNSSKSWQNTYNKLKMIQVITILSVIQTLIPKRDNPTSGQFLVIQSIDYSGIQIPRHWNTVNNKIEGGGGQVGQLTPLDHGFILSNFYWVLMPFEPKHVCPSFISVDNKKYFSSLKPRLKIPLS
jgi:hypothetical protein